MTLPVSQIERLSLLREQLGLLLNLLEDEDAEPGALLRALHSCGVVFEALQSGDLSLADLESDERERISLAFENTLRLNAVALGRASAAGESLVRGITHAKQARRHARALAGESALGSAFDLSA